MASSYEQIIKDAKQGKFAPVYYLCGEETYFLDIIEQTLLSTALSPGQEDFNLHIFYAKDTPMQEIIATCKQYPTFAERQVVLVREAQQINKQDDWKFFESYLDKPVDSTVLIIVHKHKTPDKRTALGKKLDAKTVYFDAVKLKETEIPSKIKQFVAEKGLNINDEGALQLAENLGNDLSRIVNEIDKLGLTLAKGTQVTPEIIEKYIGISREYNQFEFSNAIQDKDAVKAFKIINYFSLNPKAGPLPVLISLVYGFFSKLWVVHHMKAMPDSEIIKEAGVNPFVLRKMRTAMSYYPLHKTESILADIAEYDARSKGIGGGSQEPYELLKELTYKIMHHYEKA